MSKYSFSVSNSDKIIFERPRRFWSILPRVRALSKENLFWSIYEPKNFGDWLTPYLFFRITGKRPVFRKPSRFTSTIFGAGSIFRHIRVPNSATIWGAGVISAVDQFENPKEILAVRGPLTKKVLAERSVPCPDSFGDPGLMLAQVFQPTDNRPKFALGIVPHFREVGIAKKLCAEAMKTDEVRIIDPTQPIEEVAKQLTACEAIVSSSLHGIITSHAYGVKCGWVRFGSAWDKKVEGDDIKFFDHFSAIGLKNYVHKPLTVHGGNASIRNLLAHASESNIPDPTGLIDNLKRTCPFS